MSNRIVITGATYGIGRAIAEKFASNNYKIAICARSESELKNFADHLRNVFNVEVLEMPCDVSVKEELQKFSNMILEKWKTIDILINNAGIFLPGSIGVEEEGVYEEVMKTNIDSAYHLTRMFMPSMILEGNGHIFFMCSTASIQGYPNGASYSISKHAMLGLSRSLRAELMEHKIKVTSIIAGATYTKSWQGSGIDERRFMKPEDVSEMVYASSILSRNANVEEILMRPVTGDV